MRSLRIRVGPESNDRCPHKRKAGGDLRLTKTQREDGPVKMEAEVRMKHP